MNHKFDQFLTISALTGWMSSIAALLTIGINPISINSHRSLTTLASPPASLAQASKQTRPSRFPLAVASVGFDLTVAAPEPAWTSVAGGHWLDRDDSAPLTLDLTAIAPPSPRPLWQSYSD